jgi:hypothetical protein
MRAVTQKFIGSALLALTLPAFAGTTLLDFESVPAATTDMTAGNPYAAQGISFSKNAWSMASAAEGTPDPGDGRFYRDPIKWGSPTRGALHLALNPASPGGSAQQEFFINIKEGFDTDFSMLYVASSGSSTSGNVSLFSGLNGEGSVLSGFDLTPGVSCGSWLCNWVQVGAAFQGTAHSIRIRGDDAQFFFDDIRLHLNGSTNPVPEPGALALSLTALGAWVWSRKRRAR